MAAGSRHSLPCWNCRNEILGKPWSTERHTEGRTNFRPHSRRRRFWRLRARSVVWVCVLGILLPAGLTVPTVAAAERADAEDRADEFPRLISLNPSLTAIIIRLGAREALVGVDDYSARVLPEASDLPRVGGLFDPNLEAVLALRPDRVLIVAGVDQQSHGARLEKLGLEVEIYPNERLDEVLENIARLGQLLGREEAAEDRAAMILSMRNAVATVAKGRPKPATVAVVDRSPLYLVGGETFLDEMLDAVGASNLVRSLPPGYPRGSIEWLIAARPELLLDMTPGAVDAASFWARWPSLPAVAAERVVTVDASRVSLPGPDLDDALRELAVVVHGEAIGEEIDALLRAALSAAPREGPPK